MTKKPKKVLNRIGGLLASTLILAAPLAAQDAVTLTGAGATFPYPVYSKWFDEYHKKNPHIQINYQSIGSGGGIRQITKKTVDFGATDAPMSDKNLFKVDGEILHIPTVLGAVVPAINLKDADDKPIQDVKLTGEALAGIFLGTIRKWDARAIQKSNPGVRLPDASIMVVHRADGSGTTYGFTDYLAKVSTEWKEKVGAGKAVRWPVGLGGKGNEGVSGLVQQTPNSIGYVGLIYAMQNNISIALVQNKAGKFIKASVAGVTAAAAGAAKTMPKDYRVSIANAPGEETYPISTFTWLLVYKENPGNKGRILKGFLRWMLKDGQKLAPGLGYAPLPDNVRAMVAKTVETMK